MIELELTYLAKFLPDDLQDSPSKDILDIYVENGTDHADLRIRQNGDSYKIVRKKPVSEDDVSKQTETIIDLNETEFKSLSSVVSRKISKTRYYYDHNGITAEFDIFKGELEGLVLIDFEFDSEEAMKSFVMPEFCLADVTQEKFVAGGVLAGKTYADIEKDLNRFDYKALMLY